MSSAHRREEIWKAAEIAGNGVVYCNLCTLEVRPGDDWDESHCPVPKTFGGTITGVAHRACNIKDNVEFVIPRAALARRQWRRHHGIRGPGLGDDPLPGGRRSNVTKKLNGKVEPRLTGNQKHWRAMAALGRSGRPE